MKPSLINSQILFSPHRDSKLKSIQEQEDAVKKSQAFFSDWKNDNTTKTFFDRLKAKRNSLFAEVQNGHIELSETEIRSKLAQTQILTSLIELNEYENWT